MCGIMPGGDWRLIELSRGLCAFVDAKHFEWLSQWKWYAQKAGRTYYAYRTIHESGGSRVNIAMHRLILGLELGDGKEADHINGLGYDNRESNLRIVTRQENMWNLHHGPRGYHYHKQSGKYRAMLSLGNQNMHIGLFGTPQEARRAYLEAKAQHHRIGGVPSAE